MQQGQPPGRAGKRQCVPRIAGVSPASFPPSSLHGTLIPAVPLFLTPRAWSRFLPRWRLKTKRKVQIAVLLAAALVLAPIVLINLAVSFFGNSIVFPLSPFFLGEKLSALGAYAAHRPICLVSEPP